jgi:hypothetical protein
MPHISRWKYNGEYWPSVNTITGALSLEGLIRNYYRKHGFKWCDKDSDKAREAGSKLAEVMERYRITAKTGKVSKLNKACADNWLKWFNEHEYHIEEEWIEPHLVNTIDGYHGSPDAILVRDVKPDPGYPLDVILGDDKLKKRFPDYRLLMNEHGYAMCDSYEDKLTKEIKKVPWKTPIEKLWFWTFDPKNGDLYPVEHDFDPGVYGDFLTCKLMYSVNKRSESYFGKYAVLLPSQEKTNGDDTAKPTDESSRPDGTPAFVSGEHIPQ